MGPSLNTRFVRLKSWLQTPRLEIAVLAVAFLSTIGAKFIVIWRLHVEHVVATMIPIVASDVVFFGTTVAAVGVLCAAYPGKLTARLVSAVTMVIAGYSAVNLLWMIGTGAQVHPEVITNFFQDPREFGSVVWRRMWRSREKGIPFLTMTAMAELLLVYRFVRPHAATTSRKPAMRRAVLVFAASLCVAGLCRAAGHYLDVRPKALTFRDNPHWLAVTSLFNSTPPVNSAPRHIARSGERKLVPPAAEQIRPHVVLLVLESAAHWATSFDSAATNQTPTLLELAERGTYMTQARALVTHTSKSLFSILTGVSPSLEADYVEAVPVSPPYESLATILQARGYGTWYSQMARGSFESRPALIANLGFESFMAREDLGDPSKYVGYLSGDDIAMLEPAFAWMDSQNAPCLMVMLTSVAHDPYEVPAWFGEPIIDRKQAFLQAVRYTDRFVAEVVDRLEQRSLSDNTILCIIGDHGEGFGGHGVQSHGENPYDEALRIPWLIVWPGHAEAGLRLDVPCSAVDVTPTLLALMGIGIDESGFGGFDMLGNAGARKRVDFSGWYGSSPAGYIEDGIKVVYWSMIDRAYRFNLIDDPNEQSPVELSADETNVVRDYIRTRRRQYQLSFDRKRHESRTVYDRWKLVTHGEGTWCYYIASE